MSKNHTVVVNNCDNQVYVTQPRTNVNVNEEVTKVVTVVARGPQGPTGQGATLWYDGGTYISSSYDTFVSGSFVINQSSSATQSYFVVNNNSTPYFVVSSYGYVQLYSQSQLTPPAVQGGLLYSSSNLYLGV